jgi:hypothetical protein
MTDLESKTLIFPAGPGPMSPRGNTRGPMLRGSGAAVYVLGAQAYLEHVLLKTWQSSVKIEQ